jgi:transposase
MKPDHKEEALVIAIVRHLHNVYYQDKEAVQVGLTLTWNNGQTEGYIICLKFIKRHVLGRRNLTFFGNVSCFELSDSTPVGQALFSLRFF